MGRDCLSHDLNAWPDGPTALRNIFMTGLPGGILEQHMLLRQLLLYIETPTLMLVIGIDRVGWVRSYLAVASVQQVKQLGRSTVDNAGL